MFNDARCGLSLGNLCFVNPPSCYRSSVRFLVFAHVYYSLKANGVPLTLCKLKTSPYFPLLRHTGRKTIKSRRIYWFIMLTATAIEEGVTTRPVDCFSRPLASPQPKISTSTLVPQGEPVPVEPPCPNSRPCKNTVGWRKIVRNFTPS